MLVADGNTPGASAPGRRWAVVAYSGEVRRLGTAAGGAVTLAEWSGLDLDSWVWLAQSIGAGRAVLVEMAGVDDYGPSARFWSRRWASVRAVPGRRDIVEVSGPWGTLLERAGCRPEVVPVGAVGEHLRAKGAW